MTRISGLAILITMLACTAGLYLWLYFQLVNLQTINVVSFTLLAVLIIAIPAIVWILKRRAGFFRLPIPALWGLAMIINFLISGFIALELYESMLDTTVLDTYMSQTYHQQTLWLTGMLAGFAVITHWVNKSKRLQYNSVLAHLHFWLFVCGSLVFMYWIPALAAMSRPKRYVDYVQDYERLNILSQIGAGLVIAGLAAFVFWFARALMTKQKPAARIEAKQ